MLFLKGIAGMGCIECWRLHLKIEKRERFIIQNRSHHEMSILTHWGWDKMAAMFVDEFFKCIFLNENFCISNKFLLKYVSYGLINNKSPLV